MDNQQIQLFIIDGVLFLLLITVLLMEKNYQRLNEIVENLVAGTVMEFLTGKKNPVINPVKKTRKPRTNKTKHTGQK